MAKEHRLGMVFMVGKVRESIDIFYLDVPRIVSGLYNIIYPYNPQISHIFLGGYKWWYSYMAAPQGNHLWWHRVSQPRSPSRTLHLVEIFSEIWDCHWVSEYMGNYWYIMVYHGISWYIMVYQCTLYIIIPRKTNKKQFLDVLRWFNSLGNISKSPA
jgi:hypothetical protein